MHVFKRIWYYEQEIETLLLSEKQEK